MADEKGSFSGLSDAAAKEFNTQFITSFVIFTAVATVAHILVWMWKPWLGAAQTTTGMLELAQSAVTLLS